MKIAPGLANTANSPASMSSSAWIGPSTTITASSWAARWSCTSVPPIQPFSVMASSTTAEPSDTIVMSCIPIVPQSLA